jgi:hypothetical protein
MRLERVCLLPACLPVIFVGRGNGMMHAVLRLPMSPRYRLLRGYHIGESLDA